MSDDEAIDDEYQEEIELIAENEDEDAAERESESDSDLDDKIEDKIDDKIDEKEEDEKNEDEDIESSIVDVSKTNFSNTQKNDTVLKISNSPVTVYVVPPDERQTSNRLQISEAALIVAMRAEQISRGSAYFVDSKGLHSPESIAVKELIERKCPLILRRIVKDSSHLGKKKVEDWNVREMTIPQLSYVS